MKSNQLGSLLNALSAISMSVAWWLPGTTECALLAWLSVTLLVAAVRFCNVSFKAIFLYGCICNCLGFYWLFWTIKDFGGFPSIAAAAVFGLFVVLSCNQQIVFLWVYRRLPLKFHQFYLGTAMAWTVGEFISIRIFPWSIAHTQVALPELTQAASIAGTSSVAFLMIWFTEATLSSFRARRVSPCAFVPWLVVIASLYYGIQRVRHLTQTAATADIPVALIQGNITVQQKHDIKYFTINQQLYLDLSQEVSKPGQLLIWPESVLTSFIRDDITSAQSEPKLPKLGPGVEALLGGLTYRSNEEIFNSAIPVFADGRISQPYHKQILMPFGEFTPFGDYFPWLKQLNSTAGNFTAGNDISVYSYTLGNENRRSVKIAPLICYEDVVPDLARLAVQNGAQVLVNLTNDAWFGDTAAPRQHNLIAAFRAIENQRYLLRATNSGLTTIVNPLGTTVSEIPAFSVGVLQDQIAPISDLTIFTEFVGQKFNWFIFILAIALAISPSSIIKRSINPTNSK